MKEIAIIIPTRERAHKIQELHRSWFKLLNNSIATDCIIVLDSDNEYTYPRLDGFIYYVVDKKNRRGVTYPLNTIANKICDDYKYIGFIGDDHRPHTQDWNLMLYNKLEETSPLSMVYGNDLLQFDNLPSHIIMDSQIIKTAGFMAVPIFRHLYIDTLWKEFGKAIDNIHYVDNVIIEHVHYVNRKTNIDEMYRDVNSTHIQDGILYEKYLISDHYKNTIKKLLDLKNTI